MQFKVSVSGIFHCSLERAFRTALLCDLAKIHTGFGPMPKVTHCSEDEDWGQVGTRKKVHAQKSWTQPGGFISEDQILARIDNQYWRFQVDNFQAWMLGFERFIGEWQTQELDAGRILIDYHYTLEAKQPLLYPLNWLFAQVFWRIYMKRVLNNVRALAYAQEPYLYP